MRLALLGCLAGGLLFAGTQDSDLNVNKRYTVDSVIVAGKGWRTNVSDPNDKLSNGLRKEMLALIGQKLNPSVLDGLAQRLKKEFDAKEVSHHILRADVPDHVRIEFEVKQARSSVTATLNKALYHSKQGWSAAGMAGFTTQGNTFLFGLASDGDTLNERFAGIGARYEKKRLGTERLGLRFDFESYHQQWNRNTLDALASTPGITSDAYRTRQNFQPVMSIALAKPLTLEIGASFQRLGMQYPAAHTEASNAVMSTLRYHRRLAESEYQQDVDAGYTLRAATKSLGSDFAFTSHNASLQYKVAHGKHKLLETVSLGAIGGRAPLSDRFVAGNSYYLRGWNKFDIDPIGGNRLAHNTVDYRYGRFQAFYDAGAVWDSGQPAAVRHSIGIGVRESVFTIAVAFPVKSGHVEPIFMMGMIY